MPAFERNSATRVELRAPMNSQTGHLGGALRVPMRSKSRSEGQITHRSEVTREGRPRRRVAHVVRTVVDLVVT